MILNFLKETINLWLEIAPYLLLGLTVAGFLHVFLGKEFISKHLGKGGFFSVLKATLMGIPLPVCSCGVIPLASSLKKDGAHRSSVLSFLVSTPTTGVDSILATYSLLGPLAAIFRPLAALIAGLLLGSIDYLLGGKKEKVIMMPKHQHQKMGFSLKAKEFARYSFFELTKDIGKWLIIGTIIGGAISAFIPKHLISGYLNFPLDFVMALVIGVPLYVCATGSIPIAASLIALGFSPGAAMVFLISGPATNAITLSFVRAKLGIRSFYLYLVSITFVAVVLGLAFNFCWSRLEDSSLLTVGAGKMMAFEYKVVAGIILFILVINSLIRRKPRTGFKVDLKINISDIHCSHCKINLENVLSGIDGIDNMLVDVGKKEIKIQGHPDRDLIFKKIREAGYTPTID